MSIQFNDVLAWAKSNQLMLGLIFSAIIGTMPELLPGWREFPQWIWSWVREASKTFLNYKKGAAVVSDAPPPPMPQPPQAKPKLPEPQPQLLNE